jgi:hypothetical protein
MHWEGGEEVSRCFAIWDQQLASLQSNPKMWDEVLEELKSATECSAHYLARSAVAKGGQSLLHLAVLHDRLDCIALLANKTTLCERRNEFGLTPLDLALFLHKQKSAELLSNVPYSRDFLSQPNIYCEEPERLKSLNLEYLPQPVFDSYEVMEDILMHNLRAKQEDAIPHDRIWMGIYYDKEIQNSSHPPMTVHWIDEGIGFGVFAKERILPCSFVGEYTGVIQRRTRRPVRESNYVFRYTAWKIGKLHYIADAERMGNFTRFINHSDEPNVALVCAYWRGLPRLIFISLKELTEGVQLTFDYGRTYWRQSPYVKLRPVPFKNRLNLIYAIRQ